MFKALIDFVKNLLAARAYVYASKSSMALSVHEFHRSHSNVFFMVITLERLDLNAIMTSKSPAFGSCYYILQNAYLQKPRLHISKTCLAILHVCQVSSQTPPTWCEESAILDRRASNNLISFFGRELLGSPPRLGRRTGSLATTEGVYMPKGAAKVVLTKHAGTSRMIMKR